MNKKDIIDAYVRIRTIDQTIPDDVLDFMKDAAIEKLEKTIGTQERNDKLAENFNLASQIESFVAEYANLSPNFEPESPGDIDGKYTGPDVYELLRCAEDLRSGKKLERCWSEFGSGCYKRTEQSQNVHEYLMEQINKRIKEKI